MTPTPTIPVPTARRPWIRPAFEDPPPTMRFQTVWNPTYTPPPIDRLVVSSFALDETVPEQAAAIPHVGETFLGFKLVEELGRGAFAKVFLAEQVGLAGRLVALKVTRRATHEAERLARLHHTNIVPVYSVHDAAPIQAICMPFLGRRTIVDSLKSFHRGNYSSRRGSSGRSSRPTSSSSKWPSSGPNSGERSMPFGGETHHAAPVPDTLIGNVESVLRLLSGLALGLAHAHGRGILHLDIKPANVLIADDSEPMLLDFNLSYDTTATERDIVGGTPQYMAPEQLADVKSHGHGHVDARTDLYSLGILAYEMLTGDVPFPTPSTRKPGDYDRIAAARQLPLESIRAKNPNVTPAVDAIIQKMLAPDPAQRYQTASELRDDLERQLNNRPLRFAANPSFRERCVKWKRRNPGMLARVAVIAVIGLCLGAGAVLQRESAALSEKAAVTRAQQTHTELNSLRLDLILADEQARSRGKERAAELLKEYGLPDDAEWRKRSTFARLPEEKKPEVAAEIGELLLLLGEARWQDAKRNPDSDLRAVANESLQLNRLAGECFAADAVPLFLAQQRRELAAQTGVPADAVALVEAPGVPVTPRDHFLEATRLFTANRFEAAVEPLQVVVKAEPDHAAAQFFLAACRHQLGQHTRALERYEVAQALLPADARPFFYRGLVYGLERRPDKAEIEFNRAIALDPKFGDAYRNRANTRFRLGKLELAEDDLTMALDLNVPALQVYWTRAEVRDERGDKDGAEADRKAAALLQPKSERDYLVRACAKQRSDPKAALADFQAVTRLNPRSIPSLLNQTHLLADQMKDLPAALVVADRLVDMVPEYAPGRAARAIVLARLGRRADAHAEAARAKSYSDHATLTYQIACVYAITAEKAGDKAKADQSMALTLLRQAFRDGYREHRNLETDRDLDALRKNPEFAALLQAVKELAK